MDSAATNIKVAIRVRPMLPREVDEGYEATRISVKGKEIA